MVAEPPLETVGALLTENRRRLAAWDLSLLGRPWVDLAPQARQAAVAAARAYLDAHTHFFTYGENLGTPDCPIPVCGIPWRPTRPPVDLRHWPEPDDEPSCFTTVGTWE